ncbi:MAG: hypothetical protein IJY04_02710 [Clostridia bacterium]|nr:hypothetical protein [Clostridia bacterium]
MKFSVSTKKSAPRAAPLPTSSRFPGGNSFTASSMLSDPRGITASGRRTVRGLRLSSSGIILALCLGFTAFSVIHGEAVRNAALDAARIFVYSVLPSLFPFAVASGLLIRCGMAEACERAMSKPFRRAFELSGALGSALALGALAGYPIGAKTVISLYSDGKCSREEAERALALCSVPGIGFTVAGIGAGMLGSLEAGALIWLSCLLAAITVGALTKPKNAANPRNCYAKPENAVSPNSTANSENAANPHNNAITPPEHEPPGSPKRSDILPPSAIITETVSEAALSMVRICAFLIFFRVISEFFVGITASFPFSHTEGARNYISAAIQAILEFSSGCAAISALPVLSSLSGISSYLSSFPVLSTFSELSAVSLGKSTVSTALRGALIAATVSWSGFSVHLQTASFIMDTGLKMKKYYAAKILSAALSPVFFLGITASLSFIRGFF